MNVTARKACVGVPVCTVTVGLCKRNAGVIGNRAADRIIAFRNWNREGVRFQAVIPQDDTEVKHKRFIAFHVDYAGKRHCQLICTRAASFAQSASPPVDSSASLESTCVSPSPLSVSVASFSSLSSSISSVIF